MPKTISIVSTRWTRYGDLFIGRDGGDPLGFRAAANRVARRLSPALSRSSPLTRGFGLLALALSLSSDERSADELVQRFERFWVLAHVRALPEGTPASFAGKIVAERLLQSESLDLTVDLIQDQLSRGLWGAYRRPARLFGFIELKDGGRRDARPSTTRLTASGKELASATRTAILGGQRKRLGAWLERDLISHSKLDAVVDAGAEPSPAEVDVVTDGMAQFDQRHHFPYRGLHACWNRRGRSLTIQSLDANLVNDDQRRVLPLGLALEQLIHEVEFPYREWMLGVQVSLAPEIVKSDAWQVVAGADERDLVHLHDRLSSASNGRLEAADEHQRWLAEARGATPWERDLPNPFWGEPRLPDFGLSSPRSLFNEGVLASPSPMFDSEAASLDLDLDIDDEDEAQ